MLTPTTTDLPDVIDTVASWQREGLPVQVHPGDPGWYQRFGADALASALRVWTVGDEPAAVGFLDESELIRMAISPDRTDDGVLAEVILADLNGNLSDLLPAGRGIVESRFGSALQHALTAAGWKFDEPWTTLHRGLSEPTPPIALRVETVDPRRSRHPYRRPYRGRIRSFSRILIDPGSLAIDGRRPRIQAGQMSRRLYRRRCSGRCDNRLVGGTWTPRRHRTTRRPQRPPGSRIRNRDDTGRSYGAARGGSLEHHRRDSVVEQCRRRHLPCGRVEHPRRSQGFPTPLNRIQADAPRCMRAQFWINLQAPLRPRGRDGRT